MLVFFHFIVQSSIGVLFRSMRQLKKHQDSIKVDLRIDEPPRETHRASL